MDIKLTKYAIIFNRSRGYKKQNLRQIKEEKEKMG